jgi:hypothetical protein
MSGTDRRHRLTGPDFANAIDADAVADAVGYLQKRDY